MPPFELLLKDLRQTWRGLRRDKGFTATVLATFALCIGANVVIFSVVRTVLLKPLPFSHPEKLITTIDSYPKAGVNVSAVSVPKYIDRKEQVEAFAETAALRYGKVIVGNEGSPERVPALIVTPSFFRVLGISANRGRLFSEEEEKPGKDNVVVLSDGFWRDHFDADPAIIGRTLRMGGKSNVIIGVLPAAFNYLAVDARLYQPLAFADADRSPSQRHSNNLGMVIGLVNLVNLLLVRATSRLKERAVRQTLGASWVRLAGQAVMETMLLALVGGILGLTLGWFALRSLTVIGVQRLPFGSEIGLDRYVALVSLACSAAIGILLALPPTLTGRRRDLAPVLSMESRGGTATRANHRMRHLLIVGQLAMTFILLAASGLSWLSFRHVIEASPGFVPEHVLTGEIALPWPAYQDAAKRMAYAERLIEAMRSLPAVGSVGLSTALPASPSINNIATLVEGYARREGESIRAHNLYLVDGDYFKAMGISLHSGRLLDSADSREARVCVVDENFTRYYWPSQTAVGRRINFNSLPGPNQKWYAIVGVAGSVKQADLADRSATGTIYAPFSAAPDRPYNSPGQFMAVLRTAQPPEAAAGALRQAALRTDPGVPIDDVRTMSDRIEESLIPRRSPMLLAAIFAGMALLLAGVGVYGVLAFAVAQRQREIGVRMALGAMPGHILRQFLAQGGRLLAAGAVLGAIGAYFAGRAVTSLLFGVRPFDSWVLAGTMAILTIIVLLASFLPSRKAANVSPMEALRAD